MNPLVVRSAIVAALGGLIFGFDTAVISGTTNRSRGVPPQCAGLGFTVAIALVGTIVGACRRGKPADMFGRKKVLYVIGVLYVMGALGTACPQCGRSSCCSGSSAASVSARPRVRTDLHRGGGAAAHRGRLVGLVQFNIVLGILLAYASNAIVRALADGDHAWRWMLGVMVVPAVDLPGAAAHGPRDPTVAGGRRTGGTRPTPSAAGSAPPRRSPSSRWVRSGRRWRLRRTRHRCRSSPPGTAR